MRAEPVKKNSKRNIVVSLIALITILGGLTYLGHKQEQQKQIAKEYALYKHGFRLLEEQLAVYIKEHYEGVSKIEFSPIYEDGGDGYSMHTVRVVPIISDNHGHKAMLGTQIGRITYGSYGLGGELYLDFDRVDDSEIIILKDLDTQKELDLSSEEHLPEKAKLESNSAIEENILALVEDNQLQDVKKSGEGSPKAKISYNLEIKKGTL